MPPAKTYLSALRYPHIRSRQHKIQVAPAQPAIASATAPATGAIFPCFSSPSRLLLGGPLPLQSKLKHAVSKSENQFSGGAVQAVTRRDKPSPGEDNGAGPGLAALAGAAGRAQDAENGTARQAGLDVGGPVERVEHRGVLAPVN